ncbi:MAG: bifunctional phosphoribosylaminoimidazolecarboxamide formyltransferase/IMP cyclohydrolase [Prevotellaceae bacterium]|jgi:phosphoribosylaminoimidazolecarboxamide formyltransferase/IMP cyclohydrolase|nr:bifunctional phosphoribosylaminoimidazolecarboxamide formyltransferase/IMP cyclohydrolase [Prevotellaceae bacterium]
MMSRKKIKSALISVYYKDNLEKIVTTLRKHGVAIYSTGGTYDFIKNIAEVRSVESLTGYPSILGGRVKTLHPKIFGGILSRRDNSSDKEDLAKYEIPEIDLIIVDLYPFSETLASGASHDEIVEKIDIGGISLIRAAAKNYTDTLIVSSRKQYPALLELLESKNGATELEDRIRYAADAFETTTTYDREISDYFASLLNKEKFSLNVSPANKLRYGENPHQKGVFYGKLDEIFTQLHGKEISYNNLLDIDAAFALIGDFAETTYAIIKHNNACGCASDNNPLEAWKKALAGDPISAFGGIIITNSPVDLQVAEEINKLFFEIILAPGYSDEALNILKSKKNRIILDVKTNSRQQKQFRSILNGVLVQDIDNISEDISYLKQVTKKAPTDREISDLLFANKLVKHSKSNTIVLVKDKQLLASGVGQTSRVDALKQAIEKAKNFGFSLSGAVMASDAFFPFPDCVEIASKEGITSVIHPGGSVRDQESVDFCDSADISMAITGYRHFKH